MITLTAGLLWLALGVIQVKEGQDKTQFLWEAWVKSHKGYLLLMAGVSLLSHLLRARRWQMLLETSGYPIRLSSSFLSLMVGYLINLAVPRGGEVSRCYNLLKLEDTPVETSFGTVVVERLVDVICLVLLIAFSFFVEWDRLMQFIGTLNFSEGGGFKIPVWMILGAVAGIAGVLLIYFFRKNQKIKKILTGFTEGLVSIFRLKNKWLFIFYSVSIWAGYFLMTYLVLMAFPETDHLGFRAVIILFAIGSIAMAAPLPGGAGSYHVLVPLGLVMLYQLPGDDAVAFTFIFHAWQTVVMIVAGILSLIITYLLMRWRKVKKR